ncbi:unnamed protein product [Gongylonema pulchrum]|uniref:Uncharacterized protein n=1 Tax=Gongylonema pulchrum TaxID=637853 RepID=A0A183E9F2_9BILA|nr:unnamed protein product [Gongylonema pulchrum]
MTTRNNPAALPVIDATSPQQTPARVINKPKSVVRPMLKQNQPLSSAAGVQASCSLKIQRLRLIQRLRFAANYSFLDNKAKSGRVASEPSYISRKLAKPLRPSPTSKAAAATAPVRTRTAVRASSPSTVEDLTFGTEKPKRRHTDVPRKASTLFYHTLDA